MPNKNFQISFRLGLTKKANKLINYLYRKGNTMTPDSKCVVLVEKKIKMKIDIFLFCFTYAARKHHQRMKFMFQEIC